MKYCNELFFNFRIFCPSFFLKTSFQISVSFVHLYFSKSGFQILTNIELFLELLFSVFSQIRGQYFFSFFEKFLQRLFGT